MKRLTSLLVLFVLLGMAPAAWAGPREEVAQSIRQWLQAHREGNAEALAALYADDAVFFSAHIPFRVDGKGRYAVTGRRISKSSPRGEAPSTNYPGKFTAIQRRFPPSIPARPWWTVRAGPRHYTSGTPPPA